MTKVIFFHLLTPHTHIPSFIFLPQLSPLNTSEKMESINVLVQRKQTTIEDFWRVCFRYTFLIFHFKGLENTSAHIFTGCKVPENHLWVIIEFNKSSNIDFFFYSNITPSWDGAPEIHNSGFYLRASLAFFMAKIISICLLSKSQAKQFYYTC